MGRGGLIAYVAIMIYTGTKTIEWILSFWSLALYTVYGLMFFFGFQYFGEQISLAWNNDMVTDQPWLLNGLRYAGYNLALVPAALFCLTHQRTQRQAVISGALAGLVAIFPGLMFYIVMIGEYHKLLLKPSLPYI